MDLRERVVRAVEAGASCRSTALKFDVSVSSVIKLMQRWRRRGSVAPDRHGGWQRSVLAAHAQRVRELLMVEPDLTLAELRRHLADLGIATSPAAISRFLSAAGLTRKTQHAAEHERPDVAAARLVWRLRQPALSPERLVFADETWATTAMAQRYGRARRGRRVVVAVPHCHWKTTTFLAALRHDGITAPCGSTARSVASASWPGSSRAWPRPCAPAMS